MNKLFKNNKPENSTGFLLWKVSNYWQREIKKSIKEFDLTHTQFVVLANIYYLGLQNENVTQIDIANQIGIDKMLTSNVLKSLLKKEFITRKEHETDTRAKVIKLTNTGFEILKDSIKVVEEFDKFFFERLSNSDQFNQELLSLMENE